MANFVALTPPLGYPATFGAFQSASPFIPAQAIVLHFGHNVFDLSYPALSAPIRVLLLKKYPGTILPDPDLEDFIPRPIPDPIHIQEIWDKFNDASCDASLYDDIPTKPTSLRAFCEREVAEWVSELNPDHLPAFSVLADRTVMKEIKEAQSKKRAHQDAFNDEIINVRPLNKKPTIPKFEKSTLAERMESFLPTIKTANEELAADIQSGQKITMELNDSDSDEHVAMELGLGVVEEICPEVHIQEAVQKSKSHSIKQSKGKLPSTIRTHTTPSMKDQYDAAFPADVVVDQDSPAYNMALNYLKQYAKGHAKYSGQVQRIIEEQGIDPLAQRCAKFFAWGLQQAIKAVKPEAITETIAEPAAAEPVIEAESDEDEEDNSDYEELDLGEDEDEV